MEFCSKFWGIVTHNFELSDNLNFKYKAIYLQVVLDEGVKWPIYGCYQIYF